MQGCCFKAAVRANLPGRAADIHFLTVGKTVINALRHNEGLVFLPRRHALQRDNALCGAHYIVHAQLAVDGQQQRIVLVAVNCADLQNVLQLIQSGKRRGVALALFGRPELGGIQIDGYISRRIRGIGVAGDAADKCSCPGAQQSCLAVASVFINAAANGHRLVRQRIAARRDERHRCPGDSPKAEGIQGIKLQFCGIPLAGTQIFFIDGAQINIRAGAGPQRHLTGDSVGFVKRQHAFTVGRDRFGHTFAVGVLQRSFRCRRQLEEIELILQRFRCHLYGGAHARGGMGSRDGCGAVGQAGQRHFGFGKVGIKGEVSDVLIQSALLVVDGNGIVVAGEPPDAVFKGVPSVLVIVDAYVLDQPQLLAQLQNFSCIGGQGAADLGGIVHGQRRNRVSFVVLHLQCVGIVDIQGEGVGAGRFLTRVLHAQNHLIGVLQIAGCHTP